MRARKRRRRPRVSDCPGGFKVGDRVYEIDGGARGRVEEIVPPEPFDLSDGEDALDPDKWIIVFRFDLGGSGDMTPDEIAHLGVIEGLAELDGPG